MTRAASAALLALILTTLALPGWSENTPSTGDQGVTVVAVGDILLDRGVRRTASNENDPAYPLSTLPGLFAGADLTIANLEGALTESNAPLVKRYRFKAHPLYAGLLARAGLDVLTLANNHSYDYGRGALMETAQHLEEAGVIAVGVGDNLEKASQPRYVTIKGVKIAVLGFVALQLEGLTWRPEVANPALAVEEIATKAIRQAKEKADIVLVTIHWGTEFYPAADAEQRRWALLFRQAGADVVFGHHPHVIQPVEETNGRWVFYSLGNFVFDQQREDGRQALAAKVVIRAGGIRSVSAIPLEIDRTRPRRAGEAAFAEIMQRLQQYSAGVEFQRDGDTISCTSPTHPLTR